MGQKLLAAVHQLVAETAVNSDQNLAGGCQEGTDAALAGDGQHVAALHVHGIGDGNAEGAAVLLVEVEGDHLLGAQYLRPQEMLHIRGDDPVHQLNNGDAVHGGKALHQPLIIHQVMVHDQLADGLAGLRLLGAQGVRLLVGEKAAFQEIAQQLFVHSVRSLS